MQPFLRRHARRRSRGQSLAEFALVFPILMLVLGGIIQFGILFWGQNTLTQVARDTGRWAATQNCPASGVDGTAVSNTAQTIASQSSLMGYPANPLNVTVAMSGDPCPIVNNAKAAFVTITMTHRVPTFFPWIPGDGNLSTTAQFRMEPQP